MSGFLHTDALHHIEKHLDRFPLIKLDRILDWAPIEQYLAGRKTRYVRDNGGRPAYPLLSMFKAVLLGQWHSLRPLQNPTPTNSRNMLHHVPAVFA
ncbi:transposase [Neisseria sp. 74A18]|nr:transposase [Neisseria sp. 74A18]